MRRLRTLGFVSSAALALFLFTEGRASACGAGPGGPVGQGMCGLDDKPLEHHRFRGLLSYGYANTRLSFGEGANGESLKFDMNRHTTMVALEYRPSETTALTFAGGGLLVGNLRNGTNHVMSSGPAFSFGYALSLFREKEKGFFGVLALAASFMHAQSRPETGFFQESAGYTALDARASVMFGKTFFEHLTVYAKGSVFGGPVFWRLNGESKVGQDIYHYQVGGGLSLKILEQLSIYGEGIGLGERGAIAGITLLP